MPIRRTGTVRKHPVQELPEGLEPKSSNIKGARVEIVTDDKTKRTGELRLDKSRMMFYAELGEGETYQAVQSRDGRLVRDWLAGHLKKTTTAQHLNWVPVVEVSVKTEGRGYSRGDRSIEMEASIAFNVKRYYLGLTLDKSEWRALEWNEADPDSSTALAVDERFTASKHFRDGPGAKKDGHMHGEKKFTIPFFSSTSYYDDGQKSYLPYTKELWDGLRVIESTIKAQKKTLDAMLRTKDGIASVVALGAGNGQLLLTAPSQP